MAKSKVKKTASITLELNSEEARFLKSLVQNYLGNGIEDKRNQDIRISISDALPSFSELM